MNFEKFFKEHIDKAIKWLELEYISLQTGKVMPSMLDSIVVEAYESGVPLAQVASISVEDQRTLSVQPWDKELLKSIEEALEKANIDASINSGGESIRVIYSELTGERREALAVAAAEKAEEAKISVRTKREELWGEIQKQQKDGEISEDEKFEAKETLKKLTDQANSSIDDLKKNKCASVKSL